MPEVLGFMEAVRAYAMAPLVGEHWVILLAALRLASVFLALLAIQDVRRHWHVNPAANSVLLLGLIMLACGQLIGVAGMDKPTAPTPTRFAFLANGGAAVSCLGLYLRGVIRIRRPR